MVDLAVHLALCLLFAAQPEADDDKPCNTRLDELEAGGQYAQYLRLAQECPERPGTSAVDLTIAPQRPDDRDEGSVMLYESGVVIAGFELEALEGSRGKRTIYLYPGSWKVIVTRDRYEPAELPLRFDRPRERHSLTFDSLPKSEPPKEDRRCPAGQEFSAPCRRCVDPSARVACTAATSGGSGLMVTLDAAVNTRVAAAGLHLKFGLRLGYARQWPVPVGARGTSVVASASLGYTWHPMQEIFRDPSGGELERRTISGHAPTVDLGVQARMCERCRVAALVGVGFRGDLALGREEFRRRVLVVPTLGVPLRAGVVVPIRSNLTVQAGGALVPEWWIPPTYTQLNLTDAPRRGSWLADLSFLAFLSVTL